MEKQLKDKTLTLFFEGEINSGNASQVEADALKAIDGQKFETLCLDFDKIKYVSSAGLRVVLMLKKRFGDVHVLNVSLEVYDVLQMTGFTEIMDIQKRLAVVDVTNAELIGEGFFSLVYRINKDTIIKVFRQRCELPEIQRELNLAKQAFVLGIPTAISFDIVKVGDLLGVRFEMLDCASLRDVFRDHPERYDEMVEKYAKLLLIINNTESLDPSIPSAKDQDLEKIETCRQYLTKQEYEKLKKMIEAIPERDTFVHGDCHFKNIMVQGDELMLIDMDTLSRGHPIFELAAIYSTYIAFEEDTPGNNLAFLGLPSELTSRIFHDVLRIYLKDLDDLKYKKIGLLSYAHMIWWTMANTPDDTHRRDGNLKRLKALLKEIDDLDIGI